MTEPAPRLVPERPLPPYTFVPGQTPHPVSDPRGHSFGRHPERPEPLSPNNWPASRLYLFGFDLFNHGYFWEAHEAWEAIWNACGRRGPVADLLKGLIQLAVVGVKALQRQPEGVRWHAGRAGELFDAVGRERFLGLDLADLARRSRALADRCPQGPEAIRPFVLVPTQDKCQQGHIDSFPNKTACPP